MSESKKNHLNKSNFVRGERCAKALYLKTNSPNLQSPQTSLEKRTLANGNEVGRAARKVFPDGTLIETLNSKEAVEQTQKAIAEGALTLHEPAFQFDNVLIRVDILSRDNVDSPWNFYEVKATTYHKCTKEQKQEYRNDIGIQIWVLRQLGIPIRNIFLMHLNRECRYLQLGNLFAFEDYSKEITSVLDSIDNDLIKLRSTLSLTNEPKISIGPQCEKPRICPFKSYCWKNIPKPSVFNIPRNLKKWNQFEQGNISIESLKEADFNTETQKRVLSCYKDNNNHFDSKLITQLLNEWKYPLTYLDFEAIDYAIPRFTGSKPYQHIPFQFSCHIQQITGAVLEHKEFLWNSPNDPRPCFIKELLNKIPTEGSIIVYNASYESSRLKELARDFPEFEKQLLNINDRLVDLMVVIQKGVYYPEFMGSFSLKKVAPALLGIIASYANLEISDGVEAILAYDRLVTLKDGSNEKQVLKQEMLKYCKQDTILMIYLHQWLREKSS